MKLTLLTAAAAALLIGTTASQAAVVSTNGSLSSAGVAAAILPNAPADVNDDAYYNQAIEAFNERQGLLLTSDLAFDGGVLAGNGMRVDSHMVFLNSGPGNSRELIEHGFGPDSPAATFTFSGAILGVMSSSNGSLEISSSALLGALGTSYPAVNFAARGLENNPLVGTNDDYYSVNGDTLTVGLRVTEPGDWMRVVTVSAVPVPASILMLGAGLGALGFAGRRRRRKTA